MMLDHTLSFHSRYYRIRPTIPYSMYLGNRGVQVAGVRSGHVVVDLLCALGYHTYHLGGVRRSLISISLE